jgi:hypothetical protein
MSHEQAVEAIATALLPYARINEPLEMNAHLVAEHWAEIAVHALETNEVGVVDDSSMIEGLAARGILRHPDSIHAIRAARQRGALYESCV